MTQNKVNIQDEASLYRKRLKFPFIGIAGSNGKMTTDSMITAILSRAGHVVSFSNECDSAESLANELLHVPAESNWVVAQIHSAASDAVMKELELLAPEIGVVTNLSDSQFVLNGATKAISRSISSFVSTLPANGVAILNRDNDFTRLLARETKARSLFFGLSEAADFFATNIDHLGPEGTAFTIQRRQGKSLRLMMPVYCLGDVYNTAAAIAVAQVLGIGDDYILSALEHDFRLPEGCGRLHKVNGMIIIDDSRHSSPFSVLKSTKTLLNFQPHANRLIFGMGAMRNLGALTDEYHRRTGYFLAGMPIDLVFTVGKSGGLVASGLTSMLNGQKRKVVEFNSVEEAIEGLEFELREGDVVMVEGSEEEKMTGLINALLEKNSN